MLRRSSRPAKGHLPSGLCCTCLIQPLYLCQTGGQFIKINKEGANQHTRGMKSLPTSLKLPLDGFPEREHPSSFTPLLPRGGSLPSASSWEKPCFMQVRKTSFPECPESRHCHQKHRSAQSRSLPRKRWTQTSCCAGNKQTVHSSLPGHESFVHHGQQDQILNVPSKILSANYSDTAEVQITSERMMSLENKKNDFLTHPRALC